MNGRVLFSFAILLSTSLFAQEFRPISNAPAQAAPAQSAAASPTISDAHVLAGLRFYPPALIDDLVAVGRDPQALRRFAEALSTEAANPTQTLPEALRAAGERLTSVPEAVQIAADQPPVLAALVGRVGSNSLESAAAMDRVRTAYSEAERLAARRWQQLLEQNPAARAEYGRWVSAFAEKFAQGETPVPSVWVTDERYLLACPPNRSLLAYAQETAPTGELARVLMEWEREYGPYRVEQRILAGTAIGAESEAGAAMIDWPSDQRRAMWAAEQSAASLRIPVDLQPAEDQSEEVRYAIAFEEHARLWGLASAPVGAPAVASTPPPAPINAPVSVPPSAANEPAPVPVAQGEPPPQEVEVDPRFIQENAWRSARDPAPVVVEEPPIYVSEPEYAEPMYTEEIIDPYVPVDGYPQYVETVAPAPVYSTYYEPYVSAGLYFYHGSSCGCSYCVRNRSTVVYHHDSRPLYRGSIRLGSTHYVRPRSDDRVIIRTDRDRDPVRVSRGSGSTLIRRDTRSAPSVSPRTTTRINRPTSISRSSGSPISRSGPSLSPRSGSSSSPRSISSGSSRGSSRSKLIRSNPVYGRPPANGSSSRSIRRP